MISALEVQKLRQATGCSMMACKQALEKAQGDLSKASRFLQEQGKLKAAKKADRAVGAGIIASYIHPNKKIGVLVKLNCETDFVAKNQEFVNLAHELCLQIAAMKPEYIEVGQVPIEQQQEIKEIFTKQLAKENKPDNIKEQIIAGKLEKHWAEQCLLSQAYVKDGSQTIKDLIGQAIQKLGENIQVKEFVCLEI